MKAQLATIIASLLWSGCPEGSRAEFDSDAASQTDDALSSDSADLQGLETDEHDTASSGDRLVRLAAAEPGTTPSDDNAISLGWHDTELDFDCHFERGADGVFRCMPIEDAGLRVFSNETCAADTELVAELVFDREQLPTCSPRFVRFGYIDPYTDTSPATTLLRITGPATASLETHPYVLTYFGACNPRPTPPSPPPEWVYCKVERVDLSVLVSAEAVIENLGTVRLETLEGQGFSEPLRLFHPTLDAPLELDYRHPTELRPLAPSVIPYGFSDSSCSTPAVCLESNASVVRTPFFECVESTHALGAPISAPFCVDPSMYPELPEDASCFALGEPVPPISYEPIYRSSGVSSRRLRPFWLGFGGRPAMPTGLFWDDTLSTLCSVSFTDAPTAPCTPFLFASASTPRGWRQVFATNTNGRCADPLGFVYLPQCSEEAPRFRSAMDGWSRMIPSSSALPEVVYTGVGPPGEEVYQCKPLDLESSLLYQPELLDPSTFATVERRSP